MNPVENVKHNLILGVRMQFTDDSIVFTGWNLPGVIMDGGIPGEDVILNTSLQILQCCGVRSQKKKQWK